MFPNKNYSNVLRANAGRMGEWGLQFDSDVMYAFLGFCQARINTNLQLISNPALIQQFGLDSRIIMQETKRLFEIVNQVEIPEPVVEKRK